MERTCGNCSELDLKPIMSAVLAGCKLTGFIIPHEMDGFKKTITFFRIPMSCPKTEGVLKSESIAPKEFWVVRHFD